LAPPCRPGVPSANCIMVPAICTRLTWTARLSATFSVTCCTGKPCAARAECTPVFKRPHQPAGRQKTQSSGTERLPLRRTRTYPQ